MNQQILERLLWKDARTIAPLAIAIAFGIFVLNALLLVLAQSGVILPKTQWDGVSTLSVLLPNLLAFGCGAMLVGAEEESGSLAWLRTLPASWKAIATSKMVIALGCVLAAWALCGIGVLCQRFLSRDFLPWMAQWNGGTTSVWLTVILLNVSFGIALMLCGFLTAYLFRSPITALLLTVPLIIAAVASFVYAAELVKTSFRLSRSPMQDPFAVGYLGGFTLVGLGGLYVACQFAAKRRLSGPDRSAERAASMSSTIEGFRPPQSAMQLTPTSWYGVSLTNSRPSPVGALLWQATRQQGWLLGILAVVGSICVIAAVINGPFQSGFTVFLPLLVAIALFVIASLTFYGDSVKQRCRFLSDRGIPPALVWATRVIPALLATLIVVAFFSITASIVGLPSATLHVLLIAMLGGFSLCQLVSQWSPRPILAFFAGPPVMYLVTMLLMPLMFIYGHGRSSIPWIVTTAVWISIPLLLLASYRLTPLWMKGAIDRPYTFRCLRYLSVAILLPYVLVLGGRWVTTPTGDEVWRDKTLAYSFEAFGKDHTPFEIVFEPVSPTQVVGKLGLAREVIEEPSSGFLTKLNEELKATESIGKTLGVSEVLLHMAYKHNPRRVGYPTPVPPSVAEDNAEQYVQMCHERDFSSMRVLLHWANLVRNAASRGEVSLAETALYAEAYESFVADALGEYLDAYGMTDPCADLISQLPDPNRVTRSRISALTKEWQSFREGPPPGVFCSTLVGDSSPSLWLPFEREREYLKVDAKVKDTLERLDRGGDFFHVKSGKKESSKNRPRKDLDDYLLLFAARDQAVSTLRKKSSIEKQASGSDQ